MDRFIMITSCEEKQGKTTLCFEVSKFLSKDKKVLLIDLSKSIDYSSLQLECLENTIFDYVDLVDDACTLEEAVVSVVIEEAKFDFIPSPRIDNKLSNSSKIFGKLFMLVSNKYDYVIIDGYALYNSKRFLDYGILDKIILISESKIEDLNKLKTCLNLLGKESFSNVRCIINNYHKKLKKKGLLFSPIEMQEMVNVKILEDISYSTGSDVKKIASKLIEQW
jgi:septum formation inhibitor-activating ATPase MinD